MGPGLVALVVGLAASAYDAAAAPALTTRVLSTTYPHPGVECHVPLISPTAAMPGASSLNASLTTAAMIPLC